MTSSIQRHGFPASAFGQRLCQGSDNASRRLMLTHMAVVGASIIAIYFVDQLVGSSRGTGRRRASSLASIRLSRP